jgi:hypothetical protein
LRRRSIHTGFRAGGRKAVSTPEQDALAAAALFIVYHVECERYDKNVCTGGPAADGSGTMPGNVVETGIIVRHANLVGAELLRRAERLGLSRATLEAGEAFVKRMPYARVETDYAQALQIIGGPLDC